MYSHLYPLFANYTNLTTIKFNSFFDVSNMTNLVQMFSGCKSLNSLDLSQWNTQKLKSMSWVFLDNISLKELDLSNFDTSGVTGMFRECHSLETINLNNWNTKNVTHMNIMFFECKALKSLDLSSFDTTNVGNMINMFKSARNLKTIYVSNNWKTAEQNSDMFLYCGTDKLTLK